MKKVGLVILVSFMMLMVCGCEKSTKLKCIRKVDGVELNINAGYVGNVIKTMDFTYEADFSDYEEEEYKVIEKGDFCEAFKESMAGYKNAFTNCKSNLVNKYLKISANVDVNKIDDEAKNKITSPEQAKSEMEAQEFTCTIE